jgi:hypothetical protein
LHTLGGLAPRQLGTPRCASRRRGGRSPPSDDGSPRSSRSAIQSSTRPSCRFVTRPPASPGSGCRTAGLDVRRERVRDSDLGAAAARSAAAAPGQRLVRSPWWSVPYRPPRMEFCPAGARHRLRVLRPPGRPPPGSSIRLRRRSAPPPTCICLLAGR